MKKRILMLLCAAVLAISIAAPPALAAGGPFYPISVEEYQRHRTRRQDRQLSEVMDKLAERST